MPQTTQRSTRKRTSQKTKRKFKIINVKNKTIKQKIVLSISACSLLLFSALGLYGWSVYQALLKTQEQIYSEALQRAKSIANIHETPFTILLVGMGTNGEDGENTLADSINLITVNPKRNYAELIPIPRDSYVPFGRTCLWGAGYYDKITHATSEDSGGADCLQSTLEALLDIDINYYMSIDFRGFIQIVDALNGVEMNIPDLRQGFNAYAGRSTHLNDGTQWCDYDSNRVAFAVCFNNFGHQTVNGEEALALARTRHYDSDFARNRRQSELIKSISKKIISGSGFFAIHGLLNAISDSITTNIPTEQFNMFFSLASTMFIKGQTNPFSIRTTQLKGITSTRKGHRISAVASFNLVPIASVEEIRRKLADALRADDIARPHIENLTFDIDDTNHFAYGTPLDVGMDVTSPYTVRQFRDKTKTEQVF